jgi:hypothetical protein
MSTLSSHAFRDEPDYDMGDGIFHVYCMSCGGLWVKGKPNHGECPGSAEIVRGFPARCHHMFGECTKDDDEVGPESLCDRDSDCDCKWCN